MCVHEGQLAGLRVADAAHREWAEAHAGWKPRDGGRAGTPERGLAERIPVTDSEVAELGHAAAIPGDRPGRGPGGRPSRRPPAPRLPPGPGEKMARLTPVTDAELDRYGGRLDPELSPEAARELAELRQALRGEHHAERAGQAEALARLIPVTDAEVAKYGGVRPGDGPRPDPETWAAEKAAQAERRRAEREAEAARMGRIVPVTDAEVAAESATPRDYPAPDPAEVARWRQEQAEQAAQARERERTIEPEPGAGRETPHVGPDVWAAQKAAQTERVDAARKARVEASASLTPVTDAEVERYGREPDITPERDADEANLAEVRAELERVGELVDRMPDRAAERHAEMDQAGIDEPVVHEPQPEPSLEASWQPGDAQAQYEPAAGTGRRARDGDRLARSKALHKGPGRQGSSGRGLRGRSGVARWRWRPLPRRVLRQAAAGSVALDRCGRRHRTPGQPPLVPPQGALAGPGFLVAVDPDPLGHERC